MGSSTTPDILRGLLVPDPRFRWDAYSSNLSTITQAGPLAGVPAAQVETDAVLEAVGTQPSGLDLSIKTIRGGHPGKARFIWRRDGETVTEWRGWDPPVSISDFEWINYSTVGDKWGAPHALALRAGKIAVASMKDEQLIVVWFRNADTGAWTETTVYDFGSTQSRQSTPCLVELPSGRLLCFFWYVTGSSYQIRSFYSDDNGTTWTRAEKGCLPAAVAASAYITNRFRVAHLNGQLCMVMWLTETATPVDQIFQYASNDLGASFDLVSSLTSFNRGFPDIIEHKGRLIVAYVSTATPTTADHPPAVRVIGGAYDDLSVVTGVYGQETADAMEWGTVAALPAAFSDGDLSLWADQDGALYLMGREQAGTTNDAMVRVSYDDGDTWESLGNGPATAEGVATWRGIDAGTFPTGMSACAHRGRSMVAHRHTSSGTTADDSLGLMWLGGYTTVCLPQEVSTATTPLSVSGFALTWLPYDLPEDVGTSWAHSGTGTVTLASGGLGLITAAAQSEAYTASGSELTATLSSGLYCLADVRVTSGTAYLILQNTDSTPLKYVVRCEITTSAITVTDGNSGGLLGTVAYAPSATYPYLQIQMAIQGAKAVCRFRRASKDNDRKWALVGETPALSSDASDPGNQLRFGQGASTVAQWRMVQIAAGATVGEQIINQDNYGDLLGRTLMPSPVYVDDGVSIQAVDGPTFRNDEWDISPRYTYGVENIFPDVSPSPRRGWRSTTDASDVEIAMTIGSASTTLMGALAGISLWGANFGVAELHARPWGGSWGKVADLDLRAGVGLHWSRAGRMLTSGNGGAVPHYLPTNILAGSRVKLTTAQGGVVVRVINTNSAGKWSGTNASLQTRMLLDGIDGTENTSGTTAELWSKDYTGVVPVTAGYASWKLIIRAQTTAEGYFTIGAMTFGHVFPLGSYLMEYGWGRAVEWAYTYEQIEGRTGIRTVQAMGPTRRAAEISWVDGVETSGLTEAAPNWILGWAGAGALPVAVPADIPWSMPGLIEHLEGATLPVTYLAGFTRPASATTVVNVTDRRMMLHSTIVSESIRSDNVLGNEGTTELLRLGTARLEEVT